MTYFSALTPQDEDIWAFVGFQFANRARGRFDRPYWYHPHFALLRAHSDSQDKRDAALNEDCVRSKQLRIDHPGDASGDFSAFAWFDLSKCG